MTRGVLVTGGAGYIGSHVVRLMAHAGRRVVVVDDLSTGHRWAVPPSATLVEGNAGDPAVLDDLLSHGKIKAVLHFAGSIVVPDSVRDPIAYYRNNVVVTQRLIESCLRHGVRDFVYSSSAAVYGAPSVQPVPESAPTEPVNPYGSTKLIGEWMLRDTARSRGEAFRYVALRYFNVAGASLDSTLGQAGPRSTHLIKIASEAACGLRDRVTVFGTDYPTADGTCVRDYIHVEDLARAHVDAVTYLDDGGANAVLNCGYGHGFSVHEVLSAMQRVAGTTIRIEHGQRRDGDPAVLVADSTAIRKLLGWTPRHDDIDLICATALAWERRLARMPASC